MGISRIGAVGVVASMAAVCPCECQCVYPSCDPLTLWLVSSFFAGMDPLRRQTLPNTCIKNTPLDTMFTPLKDSSSTTPTPAGHSPLPQHRP